MMRRALCFSGALAALATASSARADDVLKVGEIRVDPPTVHAAGVQVLVTGDDDRDAKVTARVRKQGETTWRPAPDLLRVWPETVSIAVPQQFAGSIFDLAPATTYEVEIRAVDPDGGVDVTRTVTVTTRAIPGDPKTPRVVAVKSTAELKAALAGAVAGDVITLADGTYAGPFTLSKSGTAEQPIVVRGGPGAILDGGGCAGCNVLEVYGAHVHVEGLTIQRAIRGLRMAGAGPVARRLVIRDVVHGIKTNDGVDAVYVCDNVIEGRLKWPWPITDPNPTSHWDDRGVDVAGQGAVVCHNRIVGFGDPIVNKRPGFRALDVYGNDVAESYDGTELDEGESSRLWGNRFTNVMVPISIQPVHGGPAYVLRNVLFNVPEEQIKLKSLGSTELPSGALIFHNTFVSPTRALNLQTPITQSNFAIRNNLFVGPKTVTGRVVDWTAVIVGGVFEANGYWPDGGFWFGKVAGANRVYPSFAAAQAAGVETKGVLLADPIFEAGFVGPVDPKVNASPPAFTLAAGSNAIDRGEPLAGINDGFVGAGPDLGAWELGCPKPTYGPRPKGSEAVTNPVACSAPGAPPGDAGVPVDDAGAPIGDGGGGSTGGGDAASPTTDAPGDALEDGGCGCRAAGRGGSRVAALAIAAIVIAARRRRA